MYSQKPFCIYEYKIITYPKPLVSRLVWTIII